MSSRLTLPHSQQRHSNIAVVKLARGSKRIEIACYKNKVLAFRSGAETDLDEVIQIDRIFSSVARGEFASKVEIRHVIGEDMSLRDAIQHILLNGDVQVASGERSMNQEELVRDVSTVVAQRVVHPVTKRPYPPLFVEETMKAMGVNLRLDLAAKKNASHVIKELCARQFIPVARAKMRVRLSVGESAVSDLEPSVRAADENSIVADFDPEHFRELSDRSASQGWSLEVIDYAVCDTSMGTADAFSTAASTTSKRSKREARRLDRKRKSISDSDSD